MGAIFIFFLVSFALVLLKAGFPIRALGNDKEIVNELLTTSNEQRTTNNKQRTTNNEKRTTNNEQRITSNEQRITNNEKRTKII